MMNGLVAASRGRRAEGELAVRWLEQHGGSRVDLGGGLADVHAWVVTDGTPEMGLVLDGSVRGATFGDGPTDLASVLSGSDVPLNVLVLVVDVEAGRVVAGSGPGNLRLFCHRDDRGTLVSSSVASIVEGLGDRAALDRSYEDFQLGFGFLPDGRTMYEGVTILPRPGILDLDTGEVTGASAPAPPPEAPATVRDAAGLTHLLLEILEEQASGVDHVGVLLGGFDSALVAAALHRIGKRVSTFTFSFEDDRYTQRHVDEAVAAAAAEHHWVPIDAELIGHSLETFPHLVNQPGIQPHYQIQTIAAATAAREAGVERLFSGDGCDALFLAFPTVNTRAAASEVAGRVPDPLLRAGLHALTPAVVERHLGHVARMGRGVARAALLEPPADRHLPTQVLDATSLARLSVGWRPTQVESIEAIRSRLAAEVSHLEPVRRAFDGNTMAGHSQAKVEGVALRSGLRPRSPYTEPRFRAAVASLPESLSRPSGRLARAEGKPVLQELALSSELLPRSVVEQPKQSPTLAPVDAWYAGPLRHRVLDLLQGLPFEIDEGVVVEMLAPKRIEDLYRRRVTLSLHTFQAIGLLASYASFARLARGGSAQ